MSRPYRLDQRTHAALVKAAAGGATNRDAAIIAGIGERTLYRWLADPEMPELAEDYARGRAASRIRSIALIAASDDWRAHAWLLERVDPQHWGKGELAPAILEHRLAAYLRGFADAAA